MPTRVSFKRHLPTSQGLVARVSDWIPELAKDLKTDRFLASHLWILVASREMKGISRKKSIVKEKPG